MEKRNPMPEVHIVQCSELFDILVDPYRPVYLMLTVRESKMRWGRGGGAYRCLLVSCNLAWKCPEHIQLKPTKLYSALHLK